MNSGGTSTATATLVLEKTEEMELSPRILELRKKKYIVRNISTMRFNELLRL